MRASRLFIQHHRSLRVTGSVRFIHTPVTRRDEDSAVAPTPAIISLRRSFADAASFGAKPSIDAAKAMPKDYSEMKNELLVAIALQGDHGARKERLIREVMLQDGVAHTDALATVDQMSRENKGNNWFWKLPYRVGIFTAVTAGVASFPMVFDLGTALWFNEYFVTADVAEPEDLETPLEVGMWTWNWMEPPLGQISFFLLCLQWAREQMLNIRVQPYTDSMMNFRAGSLASSYPKYDAEIIKEFALVDMWE